MGHEKYKITDMHCHVLPDVDDGPSTMEESIATLRVAQKQGIGAMIVTPHFHPGRYVVNAEHVKGALSTLRRRAREEGIDIRLFPGQECYYYSELVEQLENGNVLTMGNSRCVLVEFEPETQYGLIKRAVKELTEACYQPIIAHYERYQCLYQRIDRLDELKGKGAFLQLNFGRLVEKGTLFHPNNWRKLLKDGYVDLLGSDTHGMRFRPLVVQPALEWLYESVKPETRRLILEENVKRLTPSAGQLDSTSE